MASHAITLPAATYRNGLQWTDLGAIPASLLKGSGPAYLRKLYIPAQPWSLLIEFETASAASGAYNPARGPALSDAFINSVSALMFGGTDARTIAGPNVTSNVLRDPLPGYYWREAVRAQADLFQWVQRRSRNVGDFAGQVLTLSDGITTPAPAPDIAAPTVAAIATQSWRVGDVVNLLLPAASAGRSPFTYALEGDLPAGLVFNDQTRRITGTPTAVTASGTLTYVVTGAAGPATRVAFDASVEAAAAPDPLGSPALSGTIGNAYVDTEWTEVTGATSYERRHKRTDRANFGEWAAAGSEADPLRQRFINLVNGRSYDFQVRAKDGARVGSPSNTLTLTPHEDAGTAPVVAQIRPQVWRVGVEVLIELPAPSAGVDPFMYRLEGDLPAGLSWSSATRTISGTPTEEAPARTLTYVVRGAAGLEARVEFAGSVVLPGAVLGSVSRMLRVRWAFLARAKGVDMVWAFWTGDGAVTVDGQEYTGSSLLKVGRVGGGSSSIELRFVPEGVFGEWLRSSPKIRDLEVRLLRHTEGGWVVRRKWLGQLGRMAKDAGLVPVQLEPLASGSRLGSLGGELLTDASQRKRNGDRACEHLPTLEAGIEEVWPDLAQVV